MSVHAISPLFPRQPVPDLAVRLIGGDTWRLSQRHPQHFTMVVVYRGLHCPICARYLRDLDDKFDDFAMRELAAPQADDLYELITERAGKSLILTSNRAPADWYPLFPNPVVAESLLDRLINTSHQCFMNGPSYRTNKAPGRVVPTGNTSKK